jgi:hypothetical protein
MLPCEICRIDEYLKPEARANHTKEGCEFMRKCLPRLFWYQAEHKDYSSPGGEDGDPYDILNTMYHNDKCLNLLLKDYFE